MSSELALGGGEGGRWLKRRRMAPVDFERTGDGVCSCARSFDERVLSDQSASTRPSGSFLTLVRFSPTLGELRGGMPRLIFHLACTFCCFDAVGPWHET